MAVYKYMTITKDVEAEFDVDLDVVLEFIRDHTDENDRAQILKQIDTANTTSGGIMLKSLADEYRYKICMRLFNSNKTDAELEAIC